MLQTSRCLLRSRARSRHSALGFSLLVFALGCSSDDSVGSPAGSAPASAPGVSVDPAPGASIDILPHVYPNQLGGIETHLEVMLTPAGGQRLDELGPLAAWASANLDGPSIVASGPVTLLDDDGDGRPEAFASFSIAELRLAGLLGADTTRLAVRLTAGEIAVLGGQDRLFDSSAWVLRLPEPSGSSAVGTTPILLEDASRGSSGSTGRRIALRVWYPALASDAQPARYFLDEREARVNATNNGLPSDMFDRLHGASRLDAAVDGSERRPVLLMSTGWSAPIALYSGIAQELASHGYVVVGLGHPDGSGVVVYPDGTDSGFEPETTPSSDGAVEAWAEDVAFVARWIDAASAAPRGAELASVIAPSRVGRDVLAAIDPDRVGAIGHSLGGAAAVRAAVMTPSIRASANIDGSFRGPILDAGPTTPVFVMLFDGHSVIDPTPIVFHDLAARGAVYETEVLGSGHNNFSDQGAFVNQLAALDPSVVPADSLVGTIDTTRALSIESAYVRAFFNAELSGTPSALMSAPAPAYPEVSFSRYPASTR
jgi:dienelactone hydrolase